MYIIRFNILACRYINTIVLDNDMVPFEKIPKPNTECKRLVCSHGDIVDITSKMEPFELDEHLGCLNVSLQDQTWNEAKETCMKYHSTLFNVDGSLDQWKEYARKKSKIKLKITYYFYLILNFFRPE